MSVGGAKSRSLEKGKRMVGTLLEVYIAVRSNLGH